ncbi:permease for cytosine/purines, uracil, thiamine, allantoin-domain-containing protein [Aspergillus karnatakaensis]|uniref:nucleobase cation symporter-1 family protein n=1 Tax=Aspergillus karnatakaensis TaxID=1810916 RepID=UPI003CCE13DE
MPRSVKRFVEFIQTEEAPENHQAIGKGRWSNKDLEPTYPEERTWTWFNLPLYWFSVAFGATGWNVAASLVATGLSWDQAFIACCLGSFIAALAVTGMARPGATYHIGFPVLARSAFGMYGSYFFILIRAVVCIVWYGIQTYYGANLLSLMFRCMFGYKWVDFANALPVGADVTSKQLLCFFIVWLMELPFCFVHPTKIHWLFTVKGVVMPFVTFGLFGWCLSHGAGISSINLASANSTESTSHLGWAVMDGINVIMGSLSPMLVNQPDLARYCKHPRDAGWPQGAAVFVSKVVVFFLGLASTASIQGAWGTAYWNIWDLLEAILDHYWTPAARCAVFLVAFSFMFSQFGTNFGGNSIPFGADMTGLFPRFLTIRRGQILCAILGIAVVPWKLLANASAFLSFLGSYNIFMAPLCAIIIVDYIARKGNIYVPSLYNASKTGLYWFWSGTNWFACLAWISGVALGLPGLVGEYQPQAVNEAAKNMFKMGWILTFAVAAVVYFVLFKEVKLEVFPVLYRYLEVRWEYLAKEGRDGFFDGERDAETGVVVSEGVPKGVEGKGKDKEGGDKLSV